jgi:hypothetical protein
MIQKARTEKNQEIKLIKSNKISLINNKDHLVYLIYVEVIYLFNENLVTRS